MDSKQLAENTSGYSGADINLICREAAMMPMRRLLAVYTPEEINEMKQNGLLSALPPVILFETFLFSLFYVASILF